MTKSSILLFLFTIVWPIMGYSFTGKVKGKGTPEDPYQITNAQQFDKIRSKLNKSYILMNDIDLKDFLQSKDSNWIPVGDDSLPFVGFFDGNGHSIHGLKIHKQSSFGNLYGLFGAVKNATVKNVGIINCTIVGTRYVGGLAGKSVGSNIASCYVTGTIVGSSDIGGIVGINDSQSVVEKCFSVVTMKFSSQGGGLVGYNSNASQVRNCYSTGVIEGYSNTGGIVGVNTSKSIVQKCYSAVQLPQKSLWCGVVGINIEFSVVDNVFYNTELTGLNWCGEGVAFSGIEMMHKSNFQKQGWDFDSIWEINEGKSWPGLKGLNDIPFSQSMSNKALKSECPDTTLFFDVEDTLIRISIEKPPHYGTVRIQNRLLVYLPKPNWAGIDSMTVSISDTKNGSFKKLFRYVAFAGGSGTFSDPYLVSNISELDRVRYALDKSFILKNDIDMKVIKSKGWNPIGDELFPFSGTLNGNGYVIKNMIINRPERNYCGLFGYVKHAFIQNLGVVNFSIKGNEYVGGLTGFNSGVILNCYAIGQSAGKMNAGLLAGRLDNYSVTQYCYASGSVTTTNHFKQQRNKNHPYAILADDSYQWDINYKNYCHLSERDGRDTTYSYTAIKDEAHLRRDGWDLDTVWKIKDDENYGMPFIRHNTGRTDLAESANSRFTDYHYKPSFKTINASSFCSKSEKYHPAKIFDCDLKTAWVEGGAGSGIHEWVEFEFDFPLRIKSMVIVNGYTKSEESYYANNRIKQMRIDLISDTVVESKILNLKDNRYQNAVLNPGETINISRDFKKAKLTILSVYKGLKYDDTCISEVIFTCF